MPLTEATMDQALEPAGLNAVLLRTGSATHTANESAGVPHFSKFHLGPLRFYERATLVPAFAN